MIKRIVKTLKDIRFWTFIMLGYILIMLILSFSGIQFGRKSPFYKKSVDEILSEIIKPVILPLDKEDYYLRLLDLANAETAASKKLWPASTTYPLDGAILPFRRIIAYYGNFLSKQMGVLGEYPESEVFDR